MHKENCLVELRQMTHLKPFVGESSLLGFALGPGLAPVAVARLTVDGDF